MLAAAEALEMKRAKPLLFFRGGAWHYLPGWHRPSNIAAVRWLLNQNRFNP